MIPVVAVRTAALDEGEFWDLIDLLGGNAEDQEGLDTLTATLRRRGKRVARAFHERLARALYDLDGEVLASQKVRWADEVVDPDADPDDTRPLSDDAFLYLRAAVVAAGRTVYKEVLADPQAVTSRRWTDGESLLYAAEEAAGDEFDTRYSYETGANTARWTPRPTQPTAPWGPGPCPVFVEIRDLSLQMPATAISYSLDADQRQTESREDQIIHLPPRYLHDGAAFTIGTELGTLLATNGGVPTELDAAVILVIIDVGDTHDLVPLVREPATDAVAGIELRRRPVRVAIQDATLRALSHDDRERALRGMAARCVLATLSTDHPATPQLTALASEGDGLFS